MKPTSASCQPAPTINPWASGAATKVPSEPAAETMPSIRLREAAVEVRAAALMAMLEAVAESATPISTPPPRRRPEAPPKAVSASPPA